MATRGQIGRVGTHISNVAVLVQALRHLHRAAGREAQLAICFLLQRAGRKRRDRACVVYGLSSTLVTRNSAGFSCAARSSASCASRCNRRRVFQLAGRRVEILGRRHAPLLITLQPGLQRLAACLGERAEQVPIIGRDEAHPLPFALDDQPHRHALHAPGRKPRPHLAPQQRRHLVTVQSVDDPSRLLRLDQVVVDFARDAPAPRGSPRR